MKNLHVLSEIHARVELIPEVSNDEGEVCQRAGWSPCGLDRKLPVQMAMPEFHGMISMYGTI